VAGSISTKTGRAPVYKMLLADAMNVKGDVITSSPSPTPAASKATWSAVVPDVVATACFTPHIASESFFESFDARPLGNHARFQHLQDGPFLFFTDLGFGDVDHCILLPIVSWNFDNLSALRASGEDAFCALFLFTQALAAWANKTVQTGRISPGQTIFRNIFW